MADTHCKYCGTKLSAPRSNLGCLFITIGLLVGMGLVWFALKVMDGLTYGGIWK